MFQKFQCPILASFDHWIASRPVDLLYLISELDISVQNTIITQLQATASQLNIMNMLDETYIFHFDMLLNISLTLNLLLYEFFTLKQ